MPTRIPAMRGDGRLSSRLRHNGRSRLGGSVNPISINRRVLASTGKPVRHISRASISSTAKHANLVLVRISNTASHNMLLKHRAILKLIDATIEPTAARLGRAEAIQVQTVRRIVGLNRASRLNLDALTSRAVPGNLRAMDKAAEPGTSPFRL